MRGGIRNRQNEIYLNLTGVVAMRASLRYTARLRKQSALGQTQDKGKGYEKVNHKVY